MTDTSSFQRWIGRKVVGADGSKIGKIDQIYVDERSHQPVWMTVHTGLFGARTSFVPLESASEAGEEVTVPYTKDTVKAAPAIEHEGRLEPTEQDALNRHYAGTGAGSTGQAPGAPGQQSDSALGGSGTGMAGQQSDSALGGSGTGMAGQQSDPALGGQGPDPALGGSGTGMAGQESDVALAGSGTAGQQGDSALAGAGTGTAGTAGEETDSAMTRSEEEMRVGTESVETGRARLSKHVETEEVQTTVPLRHEEARIEREPITDANRQAAASGPEISEAEHEVVLHEERPVVGTEVVPKERVRLTKDVVSEERSVTGEVRKERIDVEGVDGEGPGPDDLRPDQQQ